MLTERWAHITHAVAHKPQLMSRLESAAKEDTISIELAAEAQIVGEAGWSRELKRLLGDEPSLGDVVGRLVGLEPGATSRSDEPVTSDRDSAMPPAEPSPA